MKKRVSKVAKEKMRKNVTPKKKKRVIDHFCVAYMKLIQDPQNGIYKKCEVEIKPPGGCANCFYNRKKKRWV